MKFALSLIVFLIPFLAVGATEIVPKVKVASSNAERMVGASDSSVARMKALLESAQSIYSTPKMELGDVSLKAQEMARLRGSSIEIDEFLDFSLIACETTCSKSQFAEFLSSYVILRTTKGQSHHQATREFVLRSNAAKCLSK